MIHMGIAKTPFHRNLPVARLSFSKPIRADGFTLIELLVVLSLIHI